MTTQKHDQPEEEAFDDFLQGRGELVKQLKALSQLTPSAALDAAILASAKAAVAQAERSKQAAANDPVSPRKPGFLSRFRMPLALAASLMVAVLVTVQWHAQSEYQLPLQVAQAPTAESAAAPAVEAPQPAQADTNAKTVSEPTNNNVADAGQSKPAISATASKALASEKKVETQVAANGTSKSTVERGNAAPAQLAQTDAAQMKYKSAAIQEQRVTPAPVPPTALAAAAPPPIATTLARESARATAGPAPAAVAPLAESLAKTDSQEKQKAWLVRIEELIKTDSRKDALVEWEKFEKAYPGYPVPEKLREQIKTLKN
jgi:hypothetical protein